MIGKIIEILLKYFGKQGWWPTISENKEEEIAIGAILTQQTSWKNVERCIANLSKANALDLKRIAEMDLKELEEKIRHAGFYRLKAKRLKEFAEYVVKNHKSLRALFRKPLRECREELLSIKGIGKETADSILLYAGNKLIFVVDAYTFRILTRLGIWRERFDYEKIRKFLESKLPKDLEIYKEAHALFVELGKNFCKKRPICKNCPLNGICKKSF